MSESLVVLAMIACALSGVPGLFFARSSSGGQWACTAIIVTACGLGLAGVALYWSADRTAVILVPWPVPVGHFRVEIDGISAIFLAPVFLIAALGSIYGVSYWTQKEHPGNGRKLRLFYGILTAGMVLLLIARNGLIFLVGWELMALANFFLVTTEDDDKEVRRVGWIYLVATHFSTLCLFAVFALLASASGSFNLEPLREDQVGSQMATALFILCIAGFGLKAGIVPLHVWLPGAHAMAPSHVSAIMSGVVIKMGIYGLVRVTSFLPNPPLAWGIILLGLGAVSGVFGVAYAIGQHDLKRLLAYHSIENIGIIVMGIGLALTGRSLGRVDWVILGLAGALLHVWNHALFKALLFFGAGSIIHATHTREIDQLGGLSKTMPYTAVCFLVGAVAICGLPPLNGFASEFLLYLGLFQTLRVHEGPTFIAAATAAPALAFIGALAIACFVKVFGALFLGTSRSPHADHACESSLPMVGPMLALVACCFAIGLAPVVAVPMLTKAVHAWAAELGESDIHLTAYAPLDWIGAMGLILLASITVASLLMRSLIRRRGAETDQTWSCAYVAPTSRMQYTSSSFAQMLVVLFASVLRPRGRQPANLPLFPGPTSFHTEISDVVLDEGVLPAFRFSAWLFGWFRVFQQGSVQVYLLYIFLTLLVLLCWRSN